MMETVDLGFVFALALEAAGIVDRLQNRTTTRGAGRTFHTGQWAGRRIALVESGIGQEKAAQATEALIGTFGPKQIISAGYAGGLCNRWKRNTVCFPERLIRHSDAARLDLTCSSAVPRLVSRDTAAGGDKLALLTTDRVIATATEKNLLGRETGAELVDMETFAVAEVCRRHNLPILAIRIVLDTADEELPSDIQKILHHAQSGVPRSSARLAGSVVGAFWRRPKIMFDLFALKQRALDATDRLARQIENAVGKK